MIRINKELVDAKTKLVMFFCCYLIPKTFDLYGN